MSDIYQSSLFESIDPAKLRSGLSPSEEYALAHPDLVDHEAVRAEFDPNAREADRKRQNGVGGGIALGLEGDITFVDTDQEPTSVDQQHTQTGKLYELPGVGKGRTNWYNQPPTAKEIRKGRSGMSADRVSEQIETNRRNAELIKQSLGKR